MARADRGLTHLETKDLGDLADHLVAGQVTAGARFRPLSAFEVERLAFGDLVEAPPEFRRRQFVEVAAIRFLLFGQHAALARADACSRDLCSGRQRDLRFLGESAEAHIAHEERNIEA